MDPLSSLRELNRRFGRRFRPAEERAGVRPGPPPALAIGTIDRWLLERGEEGVESLRHQHLSGWKSAGAYRLWIRDPGGGERSLVYKRAVYDAAETPALIGFPLAPGPPEHRIYRSRVAALEPFLPRRFVCREIEAGRAYEYLFEDLGATHRALPGDQDPAPAVVWAAARLPRLHAALAAWAGPADRTALPVFDQHYARRLRGYARAAIERYTETTRSDLGRRVVAAWPAVEERHQGGAPPAAELVPIHGDCNRSNIHRPLDDAEEMKLVDWEWCGLGWPEADLVSLAKGLPPRLLEQALESYAAAAGSDSSEPGRARIDWCLLDRGILDASFLANEYLPRWRPPDWVLGSIEGALEKVLQTIGG